jgi:hypothetical protein
MRFLMLYRPAKNPAECPPPSAEHMAEMGKFMEESYKAGILVDTGGLLPVKLGARVRRAGSELTVLDGALPDMKNPVCGYAVIQVASKEEAIACGKRFLGIAGEGDSEILPLMDAPPRPAS